MLKKVLKFFINKYFLTTVAFIVWLVFFDSNNILNRMKVKDKLNDLKKEKKFYLDEIKHDSILTQKLLSDTVELERFARERYLMKKDNEDVYLIIDTTEDQHR
jgi:cell division protein DivIC